MQGYPRSNQKVRVEYRVEGMTAPQHMDMVTIEQNSTLTFQLRKAWYRVLILQAGHLPLKARASSLEAAEDYLQTAVAELGNTDIVDQSEILKEIESQSIIDPGLKLAFFRSRKLLFWIIETIDAVGEEIHSGAWVLERARLALRTLAAFLEHSALLPERLSVMNPLPYSIDAVIQIIAQDFPKLWESRNEDEIVPPPPETDTVSRNEATGGEDGITRMQSISTLQSNPSAFGGSSGGHSLMPIEQILDEILDAQAAVLLQLEDLAYHDAMLHYPNRSEDIVFNALNSKIAVEDVPAENVEDHEPGAIISPGTQVTIRASSGAMVKGRVSSFNQMKNIYSIRYDHNQQDATTQLLRDIVDRIIVLMHKLQRRYHQAEKKPVAPLDSEWWETWNEERLHVVPADDASEPEEQIDWLCNNEVALFHHVTFLLCILDRSAGEVNGFRARIYDDCKDDIKSFLEDASRVKALDRVKITAVRRLNHYTNRKIGLLLEIFDENYTTRPARYWASSRLTMGEGDWLEEKTRTSAVKRHPSRAVDTTRFPAMAVSPPSSPGKPMPTKKVQKAPWGVFLGKIKT